MEVQSAFNSGLEGFQKATQSANEAAANIAIQTSTSSSDDSSSQEGNTLSTSKTQKSVDAPSINQSIVDLKVAEFQAKASANVISTADENLGTLLDVRV